MVLNKMLEELLKTRTRDEWQEILNSAGVPTSPIQTVEEALNHEQVAALGMAQETGDDSMKLFGLPVSFDGERPPLRNLAPPLGDAGQVDSPNGAADAD
jgi:formyl-CoA transferase